MTARSEGEATVAAAGAVAWVLVMGVAAAAAAPAMAMPLNDDGATDEKADEQGKSRTAIPANTAVGRERTVALANQDLALHRCCWLASFFSSIPHRGSPEKLRVERSVDKEPSSKRGSYKLRDP